ncbi:hypothetical protein BC351_24310 [Paenibacillus ferrarius]|uniref:Uncharacterized protein n=1 Tax=Paenibacillus ferrarius TaxID=1469647 RepID=A0A1V4HLN3_9BACL|nr:hypothetical protein BC351_24310 [Paenibacillus ferrarius]
MGRQGGEISELANSNIKISEIAEGVGNMWALPLQGVQERQTPIMFREEQQRVTKLTTPLLLENLWTVLNPFKGEKMFDIL